MSHKETNKIIPFPEKPSGPETPPEFVRLMMEVAELPTTYRKRELILHQLQAVLSEHLGLVFQPQYGMRVGMETDHEVGLFDDKYLHASVKQRCITAINQAKTAVLKARFTKEGQQIERLVDKLTAQFSLLAQELNPRSVMEILTQEPPIASDDITAALQAQGWQNCSQLLSPAVMAQFKLPTNKSITTLVGEKYFYIMPQSSVHAGWNSMYVIAQPAYLPEFDIWLILQDQHIVPTPDTQPWQHHHELLTRLLGEDYQPLSPNQPATEHEAQIMSQCVTLTPEYQTITAADTFIQLRQLPPSIWAEQQARLAEFNRLKPTLEHHATHLLAILAIDDQWESHWTANKKERIYQAIIKTLSTLIHQQTITEAHVQQWIIDYQEYFEESHIRDNPWEYRQDHIRASASIASWLSLPGISQLECLAFSWLPFTKIANNPSLWAAITNGTASQAQLASVIGWDRAQKWGAGTCVACGKKTLVGLGECGVCLACEGAANGFTADSAFGSPRLPAQIGNRVGAHSNSTLHASSFLSPPEHITSVSAAFSQLLGGRAA